MKAATSEVFTEVVRAAVDLVLLVPRAVGYLLERRRLEREARSDLECAAALSPLPELRVAPRGRALSIFVSCAEASGQKHAANLVDAIRELELELGNPEPRFVGLGGDELRQRGVELIGDPVSRAVMGFDAVTSLRYYCGLLTDVADAFARESFDLVLPVDSPALHVPLGHLAQRRQLPVVHFVTPQYWGWAPWRVGGYRRAVDLALCILPFERPWFERHGVPVAHVGHPLLDELERIGVTPADSDHDEGPLVLLPGSRRHVIRRNLPFMLTVLEHLCRDEPELAVVLPLGDDEHRELVEELIAEAGAPDRVRVSVGRLHEELTTARAALSVSGTILVDLLHHRLPTVVVYRLANGRQGFLARHFLTVPWFSSVNLLAGAEVLPEFCLVDSDPTDRTPEVAAALGRCYKDAAWRAECRAGLDRARARLGPPGAVRRAARHAVHAADRARPRSSARDA